MRSRPHLLAVLVLAASLVAAVAVPSRGDAASADPQPAGRFPVAPGIVREAYRWSTSSGPVAVQLLRFRLDDDRVELTPELGRGVVPGAEQTHRMLRRLGADAVAGVNGTFRDKPPPGPEGDPEGLFVRDGVYVSNPQLKGRQWRGGFALFPDGRYEIGQPAYRGRLVQPDGVEVPISGINRHPAYPRADAPDETEVVLVAPPFGARTGTRSGTTEMVVRGVDLTMDLDTTVTVSEVSTAGNAAIPRDGFVIAASGQLGRRYADLPPGTQLGVRLWFLDAPWQSAEDALVAGPVIVRDGARTPQASWFDEGFGERHNLRAHPRTIAGFLANGEMILVTVDGRQPGHSVGLTTAQTADLLVRLGAVDAVMLDGGGSTTMAVDGLVFNRPSDPGGPRSVSNSIVLRSTVPTPHVDRIGGWDRYAFAREVAATGWPEGSSKVVLASGETFADALAGGPLAADRDIPLLLSRRDTVPSATWAALADLRARDVIVLGGEAAVGTAVTDALTARGFRVKRIAGANRTVTAARIASFVGPSERVFLASASNFPDALSATVPAARSDAPILTTWTDRLADDVLVALERLGADEVVVVGGEAAISSRVVRAIESFGYRTSRVAGPNRYATSVALADWAAANTGLDTEEVAFAPGTVFPNALVGGPFAHRRQLPVVLIHPLGLDHTPPVRDWLDGQPLQLSLLLGPRGDLSTWLAHQLEAEATDVQQPALPIAGASSQSAPDGG